MKNIFKALVQNNTKKKQFFSKFYCMYKEHVAKTMLLNKIFYIFNLKVKICNF